ncbi:MAG: glycosyltransferase family 4 protein [Firmicutes bacterium]|nr:glycosyltransferase family 4 protein [Bacillota bacterium]
MNIILVTRFYQNGQTAHVTDLCTELIRQGHQILLVITQLHNVPYSRWLRQRKIPYVTAANPNQLQKYLQRRRFRPQIIHNHSSHTLELTLTLGALWHVPTVTTVHYLDFQAKELLSEQDGVILISREMQDVFHDLVVPSYVVENGVYLPRPGAGAKPWSKKALFLAQVTSKKKENFRSMTESLLAWGWQVSSAGNWCSEGIFCHGWVNEIGSLLSKTNLVIGTGRAVREAMAWGTPAWVLGSYSDGLVTPENVGQLEETNFSGRCSKRPFSPSEAEPLLKDPSPQTWHELSVFGRERALRHYSVEAMTRKLGAVYEECILKSGGEKQT